MQDHHLQKQILYKLVLSDEARFADLRPPDIDSNVFTYHLKQLIKEKLVIKTDDGRYTLTPLGRVAGINITLSKKELLEQAHSVLLMVLRTKKGWLLRKRKAQPMYDKIGFTHAEPEPFEDALTTASKTFLDRTGLTCEFRPAGFGYVRLYRGKELESFVHFNLLLAESCSGTLIEKSRNGENAWYEAPDFTSEEMIPSMADLAALLEKEDGVFFADLSYQV